MRFFNRCQIHSYPLHSHHIHSVWLFTEAGQTSTTQQQNGSWMKFVLTGLNWLTQTAFISFCFLPNLDFISSFLWKWTYKWQETPKGTFWVGIFCVCSLGLLALEAYLSWCGYLFKPLPLNWTSLVWNDFVFVLFFLGHSVCRAVVLNRRHSFSLQPAQDPCAYARRL